MCASIREFGFKIPVLARSDGEVVDGHLRLKAARKLGITEVPVILCDEWTPQQVKAFRLMVNHSVTWADWDEDLLSLELQELNAADFDLSLTGFDPGEIDGLLAIPDEERANAAPPLPDNPVSRLGDLWICGKHRVLCGDATQSGDVWLLGDRKPILMVTDPPYGIELDREWRDRAGLNGHGPAEPSYMKHRTKGHTETTISGDTRADWSEAFELVPSLQIAHVWHASKFTREVLDGLLQHRVFASPANHLRQGPNSPDENAVLVCPRTLLVCDHLMDATRYLIISGRHRMHTKPQPPRPAPRPPRGGAIWL
jgi:hypothetical protein